MAVVLTNNATTLLAAAIDAAATTLSVETADAGKFPAPAAGDWFPLTIVDSAGNMEIVKATARSGAIITIERAQEGTTAKAFAAGTRVDLRATAAALYDVGEKATTKTVGAAIAGANGKETPADGDFFAGVGAGGSTMFKTTWGNIKTALQSWIRGWITKSDVGLSAVNNTSDADKPVSNATQSELDRRLIGDWASVAGFVGDTPIIPYIRHRNTNTLVTLAKGDDIAHVNNQLNYRASDHRFDGYIKNDVYTTGTRTSPGTGASGYVVTSIEKPNVELFWVSSRQPQIYIPALGWRALGGW